MKDSKLSLISVYFIFFCIFLAIGCSPPILKMPKNLPPIIKEYKHITLHGDNPPMTPTGIYLGKNQVYSILATGTIDNAVRKIHPASGWPLVAIIGNDHYFLPLATHNYGAWGVTLFAINKGSLRLGVNEGSGLDSHGKALHPEWYNDNSGFFSVDIVA